MPVRSRVGSRKSSASAPSPSPAQYVADPEGARHEQAGTGAGRRRVLVVDDDAYIHVAIRAALRGSRCEIQVAHTGAEALAIASGFRPHVTIVDVGLPDMDGYLLAYELRSDPGHAAMRIIFLTGHLPNQTAIEVADGNLFLGKPFRMHVLSEAVERQLAVAAAHD
jgi:DNA-binding response OmpR family regulator